jgi:hypothetical protein
VNRFNAQPWTGRAVHMGELWRLTKGDRVAVCALWNHPLVAEVRCDVDNEMTMTKAGRDLAELLDESERWKLGFREKGWTE